jgi:hypothetical protein
LEKDLHQFLVNHPQPDSGKPNKDFLAKPKATCNMTMDNVKDRPDLLRTNDIDVILNNLVDYYMGLYKTELVCRALSIKKSALRP